MRPFRLGSDEVTRDGERIVVVAAREMSDWEVRKARRAQIRFRDELYYPASAQPLQGGKVRYVLEPWPQRSVDVPGPRITYDAEFVRHRDTGARLDRAGEIASPFLWCAAPLIGLLPSWAKATLHERLGLHPTVVTRASVYAEGVVFILLGTLWSIQTLAGALGGTGAVLGTMVSAMNLTLLAVGIDLAFRVGRLLSGAAAQWGFYEWLYGPIVSWLKTRAGRT